MQFLVKTEHKTYLLPDLYFYRESQVSELVRFIRKSTADFVILGGDFNTDRMNETEATFPMVEGTMVNSMLDYFGDHWRDEVRATYGNKKNTYSRNYKPAVYDNIFHKVREVFELLKLGLAFLLHFRPMVITWTG